MIESELQADDNVTCLWFNGWAFEGFQDAKTVLIEATIIELCRQRSAIGKVKALGARLLQRVNWLKVVKMGSGVAFNLLTGLPSPDQIETTVGSLQSIASHAAQLDSDEIQARIEDAASLLKPGEEVQNVPEEIHAFREEFQVFLEEAKIDQLVVLIDDLDRSLPSTAIQTLEAIRLFLFVPKTAFVIAADEAMIEYAVRQHFPDLPRGTGPLPYARNYLEKLIQVPFRIPSLGVLETRTYVTLLLVQSLVGEDHVGFQPLLEKAKEGISKPWLPSEVSQSDVQQVDIERRDALNLAFILAQQIGPILAEGTKGNPRQVKRFLNTLMVRQMIAKAGGFGDLIGQSILAKLMLAERFQPDFYEHIAAQAMVSGEGVSADLINLEALSAEPEKSEQMEPPENSMAEDEDRHPTDLGKWLERDWLRRWLTISPSLLSVDLRPYIFVARDKRMRTGVTELTGLEVLIEDLSGPQLLLRRAEPEVKAMSAGDASTVFSALRDRVLSAESFDSPPRGFDGLAIVAKHHLPLQTELIALVESLDPASLGIWVLRGWNESITDFEPRNALISVVKGWANQNENKVLKAAAPAALAALEIGEK